MDIYFYSIYDDYGFFSNFSPHPFVLEGRRWSTAEHYFQAQKFHGTPHADIVRRAKTPLEAARLGRSKRIPIRHDWERVKESVMRQALSAKFTQNIGLLDALLDTADSRIVEHTDIDSYWGDGGDGSGLNRLGILLMELRENMRGYNRP
jgi:ribA/ribD-fused uncharacterized protein